MQSDQLLAEMQRATFITWVATAVIGLVAGASLWLVYRAAVRHTKMRVASATACAVLGLVVFVGIGMLRYQIEERPFEPPVWIEPGWVSQYLPAVALIIGAMIAAKLTRQVAAR